MKYSDKNKRVVTEVIDSLRLVSDRKETLTKIGFDVEEKSMGSGGVGQIKILKSEIRMQIGYGHGKHNYAECVIFTK